jgi:hypothetical protein
MFQNFLIYLTIGVSITWLYEVILQKTQPEEMQFTNLERLFVTLLWPIAVIWTIYRMIRG